jgi:HEAT repeat protein
MTHPKWYFVRNLCLILGEIGDRRGARALMHGVNHPDHRVKREAIQAMGKLEAGEAIPELGRILLDESIFSTVKEDQVRVDAASALYRIGGTEAIGFIHQAKGSRRKAVRSHCEELLSSLTRTR